MAQSLWDEFLMTERLELGQVRISKEDIVAFASVFDPQPFHIDETAARSTVLGGLAASGWHTCALVMNLLREAATERSLDLYAAGAEDIIWSRPVRPGDTLTCQVNWSQAPPCTCRWQSRSAIVEAFDQHGQMVIRWRLDCLFRPFEEDGNFSGGACVLLRGRPARVSRRPVPHAIKQFDDICPGDEISLGSYTFTEERVETFARLVGLQKTYRIQVPDLPQAIASDVHPLHVTAAWMQCMVGYYEQEAAHLRRSGDPVPILGPAAGVKHLRWHRPVRPGEKIAFRGWAERKIEVATLRGWGMLIVGAEGHDAAGNAVVSFYPQMLLERRKRPN